MIRLKSLITEANDKFVPMGPQGSNGFQKGKWGWMRYKGAEIFFDTYSGGGGKAKSYKAKLVKGKWPKDEDLVALAAGKQPPSHTSGKVTNFQGGMKHVEVHSY